MVDAQDQCDALVLGDQCRARSSLFAPKTKVDEGSKNGGPAGPRFYLLTSVMSYLMCQYSGVKLSSALPQPMVLVMDLLTSPVEYDNGSHSTGRLLAVNCP